MKFNHQTICLFELSPQAIPFISTFLTSLVLLMDLFHVIGFFLDGSFKPQLTFLGSPMTACAIRTGFGVIIPWRIRYNGTALDPIHIVIRRRDKICFIYYAFHMT